MSMVPLSLLMEVEHCKVQVKVYISLWLKLTTDDGSFQLADSQLKYFWTANKSEILPLVRM